VASLSVFARFRGGGADGGDRAGKGSTCGGNSTCGDDSAWGDDSNSVDGKVSTSAVVKAQPAAMAVVLFAETWRLQQRSRQWYRRLSLLAVCERGAESGVSSSRPRPPSSFGLVHAASRLPGVQACEKEGQRQLEVALEGSCGRLLTSPFRHARHTAISPSHRYPRTRGTGPGGGR
jgi:hypothetical protein